MEKTASFQHHLSKLKTQHAALEGQIKHISAEPLYDQLAVQRLKRLKIHVREQMDQIQKHLLPDIIA